MIPTSFFIDAFDGPVKLAYPFGSLSGIRVVGSAVNIGH